MTYELFIGLRYLSAKRKQAFISVTTLISIFGVMIGVMSMIVTLSLMNGFAWDLREKILGTYSHVVLLKSPLGMGDYMAMKEQVERGLRERVDAEIRRLTFPPLSSPSAWVKVYLRYRALRSQREVLENILAVTPFTLYQALLSSESGVTGVVLRGIDLDSVGRVTSLPSVIKEGGLDELRGLKGHPGILIGKELAKTLGIFYGDKITAMSPRGRFSPLGMIPKVRQFVVTGIFETGMYEYDATLAYITIPEAQKFFDLGSRVTGLEIRVKDIYKADAVANALQDALGYPYYARDWKEMNRNLFSALRLEKIVMSLILIIMILVAAFSIICTLIMMVMEKGKDIAILKSMGATSRSIRTIFMFEGMVIGGIGTLLGLGIGFLVCWLLGRYHFISLPGDIYYITTLPVRMRFLDFVIVCVSTFLVTVLATLYPSWQASRLRPAEALRYE